MNKPGGAVLNPGPAFKHPTLIEQASTCHLNLVFSVLESLSISLFNSFP